LPRRLLEKPAKVLQAHLRNERQARTQHALVDQESSDADGKEAKSVELAEAVANLQPDHADEEARNLRRPAARFQKRWAVHVALQEGDEVGPSLGYNVMINV